MPYSTLYLSAKITNMDSSNNNLSESTQKKKIIITIDRQPLKHKNLWQTQSSTSKSHGEIKVASVHDTSNDLQKLLGISKRCQQTFTQFQQQKQTEGREVQLLFAQLEQYLEQTFLAIFQRIQAKKDQLKQQIQLKKSQLLAMRERQYEALSQIISKVIQKDMYFNTKALEIETQYMGQFAALLNKFYQQIQSSQNTHYDASVKISIQQLKHKIQEQSAGYYYPEKQQYENATISFSNGHLFSEKDEKQDGKEEALRSITVNQQNIQERIRIYSEKIGEILHTG